MKKILALMCVLGLVLTLSVGCKKKAEVSKEKADCIAKETKKAEDDGKKGDEAKKAAEAACKDVE